MWILYSFIFIFYFLFFLLLFTYSFLPFPPTPPHRFTFKSMLISTSSGKNQVRKDMRRGPETSKPSWISHEHRTTVTGKAGGRANPSKFWTRRLTLCPQCWQGALWVQALQNTVNFSGLARATLKLFLMYLGMEEMRTCVTGVSSQGSHGQKKDI